MGLSDETLLRAVVVARCPNWQHLLSTYTPRRQFDLSGLTAGFHAAEAAGGRGLLRCMHMQRPAPTQNIRRCNQSGAGSKTKKSGRTKARMYKNMVLFHPLTPNPPAGVREELRRKHDGF